MTAIIEKAKELFLQVIGDFGSDPYGLSSHVPEVEKWARKLLKKHPDADEEIVLLSVWLHDIGHYPPTESDHAVRSEERAKAFLEKEDYPAEQMGRVLHCVRAHRCKDVMPASFEAKLVAAADSASHMTDSMYFNMSRVDKEKKQEFRAYAKLERDMRDVALFPELQEELKDICAAWKLLLKAYEHIDL